MHYVLTFICVCCDSQLPDKDLQQRRSTQKVDPMTGEIYGKDIYDPEKPKPKKEVCCWVIDAVVFMSCKASVYSRRISHLISHFMWRPISIVLSAVNCCVYSPLHQLKSLLMTCCPYNTTKQFIDLSVELGGGHVVILVWRGWYCAVHPLLTR